MTQEALKLALEALELVNIEFVCNGAHHAKKDRHSLDEDCPVTMRYRTAITAIKEALAESEQEPVAWRTFDGEGGYDYRSYEDNESYADDWNKRNPNHKGWVDKLYTRSQPKQEPEQMHLPCIEYIRCCTDKTCPKCKAAATPRLTWVGLTDVEIEQAIKLISMLHGDYATEIAYAIEAKLKELNDHSI